MLDPFLTTTAMNLVVHLASIDASIAISHQEKIEDEYTARLCADSREKGGAISPQSHESLSVFFTHFLDLAWLGEPKPTLKVWQSFYD